MRIELTHDQIRSWEGRRGVMLNGQIIPKGNVHFSTDAFYLDELIGINSHKEVWWIFIQAYKNNKIKEINSAFDFLISKGIDINADDGALLYFACAEGFIEIVKILLENGADIHSNNNGALRWSANGGHTEIVKILLENGADINAENNQALMWAKCNGHKETVSLLKEWHKNKNKMRGKQ